MTRKTSIIIALITVFALMGSCSKAEDNPQDTPKPPVTQDRKMVRKKTINRSLCLYLLSRSFPLHSATRLYQGRNWK
jgi:hypothetical protein